LVLVDRTEGIDVCPDGHNMATILRYVQGWETEDGIIGAFRLNLEGDILHGGFNKGYRNRTKKHAEF